MKISKDQIIDALKGVKAQGSQEDLVKLGSIRNIVIFGTEVMLDVITTNPTLQAKKKLEVDVLKAIHENVYKKAVVKVNLIVEKKEEPVEPAKANILPGVKNIVAIASGKGGVGKSTLSANLACALVKQGFKVGLVDADIYGPSIPIMFDVEQERPLAIEVDGKRMIKPIESYGVKMLSIGFFAEPNKAVVWRGPMASKALNQLLRDTNWGELDFLLIDLPPGTSDIHLSLVQTVPVTGAVVVSTPQRIALADAKKGVDMFQMDEIKVPILGLVENMAYFTPDELPDNKYYIFGKDGIKNLAEDLKIPFLGEVPIVQSIREAADAGRPAVLQENTTIADSYLSISAAIVKEIQERNKNLDPTKVLEITNMDGCS